MLLVVFAVGAGIAFLASPLALELLRSRAIHASEGRLSIEGAEGSLLSTVRIGRLAWHGDELDVEADQLALTWRPTDLLSKRFNVDGLGAKRLAIVLRGSDGNTKLPTDLSLPFEVNMRNVGVQDLELSSGATKFAVQGLAFSYTGGAREHTLTDLRFITKNGTLAGNLSLGATTPFAVAANLTFDGDGPFQGADAALDAKGSLSRLVRRGQRDVQRCGSDRRSDRRAARSGTARRGQARPARRRPRALLRKLAGYATGCRVVRQADTGRIVGIGRCAQYQRRNHRRRTRAAYDVDCAICLERP